MVLVVAVVGDIFCCNQRQLSRQDYDLVAEPRDYLVASELCIWFGAVVGDCVLLQSTNL